jgi:hypothetical protein
MEEGTYYNGAQAYYAYGSWIGFRVVANEPPPPSSSIAPNAKAIIDQTANGLDKNLLRGIISPQGIPQGIWIDKNSISPVSPQSLRSKAVFE